MPSILLSDLLGRPVLSAGERIGYLTDLRLELRRPVTTDSGEPPTVLIHGILVSPKQRTSYLGYERSGMNRPRPIARFQRWRHQGTMLVRWQDVGSIGQEIQLKPGYGKHDPMLDIRNVHAKRS